MQEKSGEIHTGTYRHMGTLMYIYSFDKAQKKATENR